MATIVEINTAANPAFVEIPDSGVVPALTAPAAQGTLYIAANLQGPDPTNNKWLMYQPSETGAPPWNVWVGNFANGFGDTLSDQVYRQGWNIAAGGSREDLTKSMVADEWESRFDVAVGHRQVERHMVYESPGGIQTRVISFEGHDWDSSTYLLVKANIGTIGTPALNNLITWSFTGRLPTGEPTDSMSTPTRSEAHQATQAVALRTASGSRRAASSVSMPTSCVTSTLRTTKKHLAFTLTERTTQALHLAPALRLV